MNTVEQIQHYFGYLFRDHGFAFAEEQYFSSFGNWVVVLKSERCACIRITQDRGEVFTDLGPMWWRDRPVDGPWFSLDIVIRLLTVGRKGFKFSSDRAEERLQESANVLREYIDPVCVLFQPSEFERHLEELETLRREIDEEIWQRLMVNDH